MNSELITYDITTEAIQMMRNEYLPLMVKDYNDKEGYELCKNAKKTVVAKRIAVEQRRKELKAESLEVGRMIDSKAKDITAQLVAIEEHLYEQQEKIDAIDRDRKAKKLQDRLTALQNVQAFTGLRDIEKMKDDEFEEFLSEATAGYEARLRNEQELAHLKAKQEAEDKARNDARDKELLELRAKAATLEATQAKMSAQASQQTAQTISETKAAYKINDDKLFLLIKTKFSTLELCWVELARLYKREKERLSAEQSAK